MAPSSFNLISLALTLAIVFPITASKGVGDDLGAKGPKATMTVDHSAWDKLLAKYVVSAPDGINRFAYRRVTSGDKSALKAYVAALQDVRVSALDGNEQRAFWINLYNALTIDVVLDRYPVKTIRDISISPGLFSLGPWGKALVAVESRKLSLDNIEHDILRKGWRDPRVHYAVNCASISCPNLMATAFTGAKLEQLLDDGARDYVNHPRGVRVEGGKVTLSSIYSWYRRDFGRNDVEVLHHISVYAKPALKKQLAGIDRIDGYDYDWSLNEAK